jgi:hypothetical protein
MMRFLEHIDNRAARKPGKKRKGNEGEVIELPAKLIGYHSYEAYVNALMDLWRVQYSV